MQVDLSRLNDTQLALLADYSDGRAHDDLALIAWFYRELTEALRFELAERRRPHMWWGRMPGPGEVVWEGDALPGGGGATRT
jgi:hypothetical protein